MKSCMRMVSIAATAISEHVVVKKENFRPVSFGKSIQNGTQSTQKFSEAKADGIRN